MTLAIIFLGVTAYMGVAIDRNFNRAIPLLVIWCLVVGYNIYAFVRDRFGDKIAEDFQPTVDFFVRNIAWFKWYLNLYSIFINFQ